MAYKSGICGREKRKCNASMENEKGWLPQIEITTQKEEWIEEYTRVRDKFSIQIVLIGLIFYIYSASGLFL